MYSSSRIDARQFVCALLAHEDEVEWLVRRALARGVAAAENRGCRTYACCALCATGSFAFGVQNRVA
jgi:hypothetical protein